MEHYRSLVDALPSCELEFFSAMGSATGSRGPPKGRKGERARTLSPQAGSGGRAFDYRHRSGCPPVFGGTSMRPESAFQHAKQEPTRLTSHCATFVSGISRPHPGTGLLVCCIPGRVCWLQQAFDAVPQSTEPRRTPKSPPRRVQAIQHLLVFLRDLLRRQESSLRNRAKSSLSSQSSSNDRRIFERYPMDRGLGR